MEINFGDLILEMYGSAKEKLLKLSDIMSYVNVVNIGYNEETQEKCRGREATEVSTEHECQCMCVRMGKGHPVNSSICSV